MGSFTSVPALREDSQDVDFEVPHHATRASLIHRCLSGLPLASQPISRSFIGVSAKSPNHSRLGTSPAYHEDENESAKFAPAGLRRLSFLSEGIL